MIKKTTFVIVLILCLMGLVGCATTKGDWQKTTQLNTVGAYKEFLIKHPQNEFTNLAREKIEELEHDLEWQKAKHMDTIEVYKEFIKKYPRSEFNSEATTRIERLAWEKTRKLNTVKAYQEFLRTYPHSKFTKVDKFDNLGITIQQLDENIANALDYKDYQTNGGVLVVMTERSDFMSGFVRFFPDKVGFEFPNKTGFKVGDIVVSVEGEKSSTFDGWKSILEQKQKKWKKITVWREQTYFTIIAQGKKIWTVKGYDVDIKEFENRKLQENSKINSKIKNKEDARLWKGEPDYKGYSDSSWGPLETWVYEEGCSSSLFGKGYFYYLYFNKDGTLKATRCDYRLSIHSH